jgi:hypothetical protein
MTLTQEKKKPSQRLYDYTTLIYGETKIGKSTLLSQIPNILFLNTGGGLEAIECYEEKVDSWERFLSVGLEIVMGDHKYEAIAIDTVDRLHKLCSEYMMTKLGILYPSDLEFGKGWDMVKTEFMRPIMKLVLSKYGVFFISHSKEIELKTRTAKIDKVIPSMSDSLYNVISPVCGIILYYDTVETPQGDQRLLRTTASERWIAGDRTGKLQEYGDIIMDAPPANNWNKIQQIFDGKLMKGV